MRNHCSISFSSIGLFFMVVPSWCQHSNRLWLELSSSVQWRELQEQQKKAASSSVFHFFFLFRFYYDKLWPKSIAHSSTQVMLPVHWLQNLELRITLILFSLRAGWRAERAGEETVIPKNEERSLRVSCWASSPAKQHPATKIFWGRVHW